MADESVSSEAFGLSNYTAWEVAQIYIFCWERGYILPTVYQGPYSLLARTGEDEYVRTLKTDLKADKDIGCSLLLGSSTFALSLIAFLGVCK